ncbi:proline--tRNA ligase [Candidatus Berkelbacteria bacterium]|nr:proline--tRNA ligase [Candidatus Berkelbacteria bacterium]
MRQSDFFEKTLPQTPQGVTSKSAAFLIRGQFITQLMSGVYTLLPLGFLVHQKIENIIREEMEKIGGRELLMPALSPLILWQETGRDKTIDPPLFKFKDRAGKEIALNPTHEEVIFDLVRRRVKSYQDLPFMLFQIQNKFRNELRSTGGLLRTREFVMLDAYSFHATELDRQSYYKQVERAYKNIFRRLNLKALMREADPGTIGGESSHEFFVFSKAGEDEVNGKKAIEVGHIFNLGCVYSQKMQVKYTDQKGQNKEVVAGCYGIGVGRLISAIVEESHDEKGIIWPKEAAPYLAHLLVLGKEPAVIKAAEKLYQDLIKQGREVLLDDRDVSAGEKLVEADLLGLPYRLVISAMVQKKGRVEVKERGKIRPQVIPISKVDKFVKWI